ncbi:hypothetical protein GCM10027037_16060 [Mucilaginibacter koreensis]
MTKEFIVMKKHLLLLLGFVGMMSAGCLKKSEPAPAPAAPTGTFTGQFIRYHKKLVNNAYQYDTLRTNVTVKLTSDGYKYNMTGDTTIHSGSNGTFAYDANYIRFNDVLLPSNLATEPVKPHLVGLYAYAYDGTNFILERAYQPDTLRLRYNLKKTAN